MNDIYMDQAATSHPKPPEVLNAMYKALTELNCNPGRSSHRRALQGARLLLTARETLAELLNAPEPECIIFCLNCTDALNTAIKGILHVGDHVIASSLEHNSVLRILEGLRSRKLIEVTLIDPEPGGMVNPHKYLAAFKPHTALCILTHVSNVTGVIQPVEALGEITHRCGVKYLVDGAQAVGHTPVDVQALKCDLYAFPGHKGLLGPQGTGGLYIAPRTPLRPFREGGTGSASDSMLQPTERPECYESGTLNLPGIAGLAAGARLIGNHLGEYMKRERTLTHLVRDGLSQIETVVLYSPCTEYNQLGVISFNIGEHLTSSEACDMLDAEGISVRGGIHCAPGAHKWLGTLRRGAVRVSTSWQNTETEIKQLLLAVQRIKSKT